MPGSLLSKLGTKELALFYSFASKFKNTCFFAIKDKGGNILACSLVSSVTTILILKFFISRFLFLIPFFIKNFNFLISSFIFSSKARYIFADPEILFIFTDQKHRGAGLGARIVSEIFKYHRRNFSYIYVKTLDHPSNLAIKFYEYNGFVFFSKIKIINKHFLILRRYLHDL